MLCTWNINKNIVANAEKLVKDKDVEEKLMDNWQALIRIADEREFNTQLRKFCDDHDPEVIKYLAKTWFPHFSKFVNV